MCVCVRVRSERKKDGVGAMVRETIRPWVTSPKWGADERAYESGVAGREAEKGSLIASECKRFGVRWDTGKQSGGRAG